MEKTTCIISLISEQTIPNVQFIKWYLSNYQENVYLLFLTTENMDKKDKKLHILNALSKGKPQFQHFSLQTDENNIDKTIELLEKHFKNYQYDKIVVNITGGTKLMSLATYQYFYGKENTKIFYQPIKKALQQLYPEKKKYDMFEMLTIGEFLKAHGIKYKYNNKCIKDWDYNKLVYDLLIEKNRNKIKSVVSLQNQDWYKKFFKKNNSLDLTKIDKSKLKSLTPKIDKEELCNLVQEFSFNPACIKQKEIFYIAGGWFEEYVYQKVCNEFDCINESNVAINVSIEKGKDKNELDIIYLDIDNQLNVIECKSFIDEKNGAEVLNNALYKLQAIIKTKFGLLVKHHFYTKSIIEKDTPLNRAKEFGITIIDGREI